MVRDSHDSTGRHQRCDDGRTEHLADYGKKLCPVDYAAMETAIKDKISSGSSRPGWSSGPTSASKPGARISLERSGRQRTESRAN